jgi:hypothetical protein
MNKTSLVAREQQPTVAMSEETRVEIAGEPIMAQVPKPEPEVVVKPPVNEDRPVPLEKEKKHGHGEKIEKPGKFKRFRSRPFVIVLMAVILLAVLALGLSSLFRSSACSSIEECMTLHVDLQNKGDLEGSLAAMEKAIQMVPSESHRDFAWIWCERAILLDEMGRKDEAKANRNNCAAWERGE